MHVTLQAIVKFRKIGPVNFGDATLGETMAGKPDSGILPPLTRDSGPFRCCSSTT
jgi:hypothetical protein